MTAPLHILTAIRTRYRILNVWTFTKAQHNKKFPTWKFEDLPELEVFKGMLQLPIRVYYWRVRVGKHESGSRRVTIRRMGHEPEGDATMLFDEAFSVWWSYVRML